MAANRPARGGKRPPASVQSLSARTEEISRAGKTKGVGAARARGVPVSVQFKLVPDLEVSSRLVPILASLGLMPRNEQVSQAEWPTTEERSRAKPSLLPPGEV